MEITQPSLTRISQRAGVKTIAQDCYDHIRALMCQQLETVIRNAVTINSGKNTKTLMADDIYETLALMGINLAKSDNLSTTTIPKK